MQHRELRERHELHIAMLVVGCVVVAWLALVAERRIPARVNGVRDAEDAVPEAPVVPGQA